MGYSSPGWHFAINLFEHVEDITMKNLDKILEKEDNKGIIQWFKYYLPRCIGLVPARRRKKFLDGFGQAIDDEKVF